MPAVLNVSKAEIERMVEARARANTPTGGSAPGRDNLRPTDVPSEGGWRGATSPYSRNAQSKLTVEGAQLVCDYFRAVNQNDASGLRKIAQRANLQSVGVLADGGFGVPEQFVTEVLIELPKLTPFTDPSIVRIVPMAKETMRWTKVVSRPSNPSHVAEGGTYSKTKVTFGPITLVAKKIGEIIPFTEEILESNEIAMVQVVAQLVAEAFAFKYNSLVTNGLGTASEPEGVLTNANIAEATWTNTDDQTKADSLIEVFHTLASQYRSGAIWMMPDALIKMVRKLKDLNGDYLWVNGFGVTPPTLLGKPVFENPDMGATAMLFGDFRRGYVIGKKTGMQASQNSSGDDWEADIVNFKFRERWDGRVHDEAAFVKTTVA